MTKAIYKSISFGNSQFPMVRVHDYGLIVELWLEHDSRHDTGAAAERFQVVSTPRRQKPTTRCTTPILYKQFHLWGWGCIFMQTPTLVNCTGLSEPSDFVDVNVNSQIKSSCFVCIYQSEILLLNQYTEILRSMDGSFNPAWRRKWQVDLSLASRFDLNNLEKSGKCF